MCIFAFIVEKSTDVELRELLLELCQTPLSGSQVQSQSHSHSQSQAFPSSQSQSQCIGEVKLQKLHLSHSLLSAHSLFLDGEEESEVEGEGEELAFPENNSNGERDELVDMDMEGDDHVDVDSGDDLFIAMETELDSRKYTSPVVKISSESEQQQQEQVTPPPPKPTTARSKLSLDFQRRKKGRGGGRKGTPVSPFQSPKPPRLRYKAEETDEESEVELPISTPLASPIPPSPKSKELQSDILKELDSFSSSCGDVGRELDQLGAGLTDSQFGVPYSQLQTPSSQYSRNHPELDKVWNSTAAPSMAKESLLDTHLPLKLETGLGGRQLGLGQSVQLEYDMPEITASQLETSSDPLFISPLETDLPRSLLTKGHQSALVKGQSSSSRGPSPLVMHQQTSQVKGQQASTTTTSLRKTKRQLFRKPSTGGSSGKGVSPKRSVSSRTRSKRKNKDKDRDIPQLDGTDGEPVSSTGSKGLPRKRKRTLGVQHRKRKLSKSSKQPLVGAQLLNEEEVGSTSSEIEQESSMPEATVEVRVTGSGTQDKEENDSSSAAAPHLNEGTETSGQVLLEEGDLLYGPGGNIQCGLVETEVWEQASCEASGDASGQQQSTREKARLSLSLKKSANRTHRTRESDPDLVIAEAVINPSWIAEGESVLRATEMAAGLSSPARIRERPEVVSSPSRKVSHHLKEKMLRHGLILKLDKLPTKLNVRRSTKDNTVAALTENTGGQTKKKPSSKRRRRSTTSMSSGNSELEAGPANEREKRYQKRCQKRTTRTRWSPQFLAGMSYEQQLKRAIEVSRQTYLAESAQQQSQCDTESAEPLQTDAESAQRQDGAESAQLLLSDIGQEGSGGMEWEEPEEGVGPGSPLMFSPPSSPDDVNRTVVEESPLRDDKGMDDGILNEDGFLAKSYVDEGREEEETGSAAGDGINNEWNLDMSISSISESPPYASSPAVAAKGEREREGEERGRERGREEGEKDQKEEEELLHDSTLNLQLETSFTELPSSPRFQSSSPIQLVTRKPPFDADTSFLSEDSFPCVILASEVVPPIADTNLIAPTVANSPNAKVTAEDSENNSCESPIQPSTASKTTHSELEAARSHDDPSQSLHSDYPAVSAIVHSPESSESHDQVLPSQMDVSGSSEEDFHLFIGSCSSASSSEDEVGGGRDSPDRLDFSIEKTSRTGTVRFEQCLLPMESLYEAKDEADSCPHSSQVEKGERAASKVIVLGRGEDGSELAPPTVRELAESASSYGLPSMRHQEPFYSCPADVQRPL